MRRIIEVIVSKTGETTIQTKGYAGNDCFKASKFLEEALGVVSTDKRTTEFYQSATTSQEQQAQV